MVFPRSQCTLCCTHAADWVPLFVAADCVPPPCWIQAGVTVAVFKLVSFVVFKLTVVIQVVVFKAGAVAVFF